MRHGWIVGGALLAVALMLGCGVKSRPIPPSQTHPERVSDLSAKPDSHGIRLTWSRPMRYTGGRSLRDLAGFRLLRARGAGAFKEVAQLPVGDQERFQKVHRFAYVDTSAKMGLVYRYEIIAETTDGYQSAPSNIVTLTRTKPRPPPSPENFVLPKPSPIPGLPTPAPTP